MRERCTQDFIHQPIVVIVVYAPTNKSAEEAMEAFMEQLQQTINGIPKHDILPIIGDFNAKVCSSNTGHVSAMWKHRIGEHNANGEHFYMYARLTTW